MIDGVKVVIVRLWKNLAYFMEVNGTEYTTCMEIPSSMLEDTDRLADFENKQNLRAKIKIKLLKS